MLSNNESDTTTSTTTTTEVPSELSMPLRLGIFYPAPPAKLQDGETLIDQLPDEYMIRNGLTRVNLFSKVIGEQAYD